MAMNLMRAVQYSKYGGGVAGLKHVEVPVPSPKKDEALIKVEAASINPIDWKIQNGIARPFLPRKFPHIPGTDVAGEIVQVGAGVNNFKAGDKVVAVLGNGGALAEFAVAHKDSTVLRPPEVSSADAAALPIAGLAAHQSLTKLAGLKLDGSGPPVNVLITAASGGVGTYAVQLAKLANVHVTATCGARNMELVRSLGADEPTFPGLPLRLTFTPKGKVVDTTPGFGTLMSVAAKKITFAKKQLLPLFTAVKQENLDYLVKLMQAGKLKSVIDSTHPLSKAEEAWAKSIDGHATGKILVEP
ncbi:Quinone-oxidoreductase-like protein [Hibiscus syriacus]|uniref:Quinone-oxidoreductase-like protein n=1 Tax=Hibiscus syriacus TaxID=106335 RepID=A0A6A2Z426_HIBSY|nr:Quinone-oxidoreductase-like protein [Hibiscus syriacus]